MNFNLKQIVWYLFEFKFIKQRSSKYIKNSDFCSLLKNKMRKLKLKKGKTQKWLKKKFSIELHGAYAPPHLTPRDAAATTHPSSAAPPRTPRVAISTNPPIAMPATSSTPPSQLPPQWPPARMDPARSRSLQARDALCGRCGCRGLRQPSSWTAPLSLAVHRAYLPSTCS